MLKHLYFTILLTFVVGIASGIYAYFLTREDTRSSSDTTAEDSLPKSGYEVVAYAYGGCERVGCASIRLSDDGTYIYLAHSQEGKYERFSDVLTSRQHEILTDLVEQAPFEALKETVFTGSCPTTYDGIAYRFTIRRAVEQYSFDSCEESLDREEFFETVIQYFAIMDAMYTSQ